MESLALALRRVSKTRTNVRKFQLGKVVRDFRFGNTIRQAAKNVIDGDTQAANCRLSAALAGFNDDTVAHGDILAGCRSTMMRRFLRAGRLDAAMRSWPSRRADRMRRAGVSAAGRGDVGVSGKRCETQQRRDQHRENDAKKHSASDRVTQRGCACGSNRKRV